MSLAINVLLACFKFAWLNKLPIFYKFKKIFYTAIKALAAREAKTHSIIQCNLEIVPSKEMPELSIIDFLMWAVQRNLIQGESRYFEALKSKYETVINLYEEEEQ